MSWDIGAPLRGNSPGVPQAGRRRDVGARWRAVAEPRDQFVAVGAVDDPVTYRLEPFGVADVREQPVKPRGGGRTEPARRLSSQQLPLRGKPAFDALFDALRQAFAMVLAPDAPELPLQPFLQHRDRHAFLLCLLCLLCTGSGQLRHQRRRLRRRKRRRHDRRQPLRVGGVHRLFALAQFVQPAAQGAPRAARAAPARRRAQGVRPEPDQEPARRQSAPTALRTSLPRGWQGVEVPRVGHRGLPAMP